MPTKPVDSKLLGASQPFPDIYNLIHVSPAFRTNRGRIRPVVETYALKGQRNRRVRVARPRWHWHPGLEIPQIAAGRAKKLLQRECLAEYVKRREGLTREKMALRNRVDSTVQGPGAAFFNE